MRALVVKEYGAPEVLKIAELPKPAVVPGQILVRLLFSGVNPIDAGVRAGRVLPDEPGRFPMI